MAIRKRPSLQGYQSKSQGDLETSQQASYKPSGLRNEIFAARSETSSPRPGPSGGTVTGPMQSSALSRLKAPSPPWNHVNLQEFRDPDIPDETLEAYIAAATEAKCKPIVAREYFKYLWEITQPDDVILDTFATQLNDPAVESLATHLAGEGIAMKAKQNQFKLKGTGKGGKNRELSPADQKEAASNPKCPICQKTGHAIYSCKEFLLTSKDPEHSKLTEPEPPKLKEPEPPKLKKSEQSKLKESQHSSSVEPEQPIQITESSISGTLRAPSRQQEHKARADQSIQHKPRQEMISGDEASNLESQKRVESTEKSTKDSGQPQRAVRSTNLSHPLVPIGSNRQPFREPVPEEEDAVDYVDDAEEFGCLRILAWYYWWHILTTTRPDRFIGQSTSGSASPPAGSVRPSSDFFGTPFRDPDPA